MRSIGITLIALCGLALFAWALSFANVTLTSVRGTLYIATVSAAGAGQNQITTDVERAAQDNAVRIVAGVYAAQTAQARSRANVEPLTDRKPDVAFVGFKWWNYEQFKTPPFPGADTRPIRIRLLQLSFGWMFAVLALLYGTGWTVSLLNERRRAKRDERSRCTACGYDLRATPGRCPECGLVPTASTHLPIGPV